MSGSISIRTFVSTGPRRQFYKTPYFRFTDISPYFRILFYRDLRIHFPFYKNMENMSVKHGTIIIAFLNFLAHFLNAINRENGDLSNRIKNCIKSPFSIIKNHINRIICIYLHKKLQKYNKKLQFAKKSHFYCFWNWNLFA